ncbi:MAG TPA: DUF4157 domain-containing protein [Candidatus Cybelea sp.]|nr:DUF4157 domain-containing protein [Candidatus Cybelea sp.]
MAHKSLVRQSKREARPVGEGATAPRRALLPEGPARDQLEYEADRIAEQAGRPGAAALVEPKRPSIARTAESGNGAPLEPSVRALMEPRFGYDFSGVRVHTDAEAGRSARSFGALAYTAGQNVVFGAGQYAPHSGDGQRLLAHELAHVVQQSVRGGTPSLQMKPIATRFQDEPTLDDVSDGKKVLKAGDTGEAVIRVTTALSELGDYPATQVDEVFGPMLTSAVTKYQTAKGLNGKVPAGVVDKQTFDKLDADFSAGFKVERDVLAQQKSPDLLKQTQTLDPAERSASARAISTETPVNPATGLPPVFKPDIPLKGNYGVRLRAAVDKEIVDEWTSMAQGKTAARGTPGALYDAPTVDSIAVEAQNAVKAVFGEYLTGRAAPPLKMGVNIGDAWKKKEDTLTAGGKAAEDGAVDWRVQKILDGDSVVKGLDREHGAIQSRAPEQAIVGPIKTDMIAKYHDKLLELHKAWPGFASGGVVYVQLFKGGTPDKQRFERWDFFQTFIHEYIHTLEDPKHVAYRGGLGEQKGGFTLREGTTDYFTKIVWSSLKIDEPLRARIEGPVHDPANNFAIQPLNTYDEAENAERLAGVVGIRNLAAAFFLGKVELIGKP